MKNVLAMLVCALAFACNCGTKTDTDAGTPDAAVEVDAGLPDAGQPDAGPVDAGHDAGPPPELTIKGLLPPRGASAGGTSVLLEGTGFLRNFASTGSVARPLTTIKVGGNTVQDFQIIDDQTIEFRTPPGVAGRASVAMTNPNGSFNCNNCFTYFDELVVTGFTPREGPLSGGTEVTLTGKGFTADTQVLFGAFSSPVITFVSATQLKALSPRGTTADVVDLVVYNKNGVSNQRRAYRYLNDLRVTNVTPHSGPLAGGTSVTITGTGFTGATEVRFGTQTATFTVDSDTRLSVVSPIATIAGAVDITVVTPQSAFTAKRAFTFFDPTGAFAVFAVYPHVITSGDTVTLTGQGLDVGGLTVTIGGQPVTVGTRTFSTAQLTIPPRATAPRISDVVVNTSTLTGAVTWRLALTSLSPTTGPAAGGTTVTAVGSALPTNSTVFLGALAATGLATTGESTLSFSTPRGAGGAPSDLVVRETTDPENEGSLPGAFTFLEALSIGRVQPERGAISGGTLVTVLGAGFGDATIVSFGASKAKDLKVLDSHTLTCRIPKGDVGVVDVRVDRLTQRDTLPGGFSYYDPRSISGGLSGGPLVGTLNITVLDSTQGFYGAPVPLATVMLGNDATTPFQGLTDARGQITFSDPSLVKAQIVTVFMTGYQSVTVSAVAAENLTVFISRTGGGEGNPGPPPPGTPASLISGRVTGFKSPRPLRTGEVLEARVFVAQGSLYGGPPFAGAPNKSREKWRLTADGADYLVYSGAGLRAVYAVLGIWNASAMTFTPVTMGVKRGVTTSPDNPATNEDIVLDMQLDLAAPVTIDSPLSFPGTSGPQPALNSVYAWLDLGAEGFIPAPSNWDTGLAGNSSISSAGAQLTVPNLPQLDGSNFIFLDEAAGAMAYPVSYYFRRQPGDLRAGITIGPMLPTPNITAPTTTTRFTGTISWTMDPGGVPDLHNVQILRPTPFGNVNVWNMVLPGTETQVVLPQPAVDKLLREEAGNPLFVVIWSSRAPKFAYAQWTYDTLSGVSWSAYTIALSQSFTP